MTSVAFQKTKTQTFLSLGFTKQNSHEQDPGSLYHSRPSQSKTRCLDSRKASQMSVLKRESLLEEHQKLRATRPASEGLAFKGNAWMLRVQ